MKAKGLEFTKTAKGVTIWYDGRWVLDASMIKQSLQFEMITARPKWDNDAPYFKKTASSYGHTEMELVLPKKERRK